MINRQQGGFLFFLLKIIYICFLKPHSKANLSGNGYEISQEN